MDSQEFVKKKKKKSKISKHLTTKLNLLFFILQCVLEVYLKPVLWLYVVETLDYLAPKKCKSLYLAIFISCIYYEN